MDNVTSLKIQVTSSSGTSRNFNIKYINPELTNAKLLELATLAISLQTGTEKKLTKETSEVLRRTQQ